ncbi:MAG: peptidase S8 [Sphingobacteriales bacterium UTBCD1]|jgi:subtilisin family serine protease|nr:MAG: peptidase S8 [Sphingobacteriales bacterium UTBCD1]
MKDFSRKFFWLIILSAASFFVSHAQTSVKEKVPNGWYLLDEASNGYPGISIDKAYDFLKSKKIKSKTVVVAVIDSGVDTTHEDLKSVLWRNPGEIPGNGIDDDHNGYVDDVYGWNFLGNKDGRNVEEDSYEGARVYHEFKDKWGGKTVDTSKLSNDDKYQYIMWKKAEASLQGDNVTNGLELIFLKNAYRAARKSDSIISKALGKDKYTGKDLDTLNSNDPEVKRAKMVLLPLFQGNDAMETNNQDFIQEFSDYVSSEVKKSEALENPPKDFRGEIVKDNYSDINDRYYGNNNVMVSPKSALHGTHVTGIIGADRTNGIGINGIADNVKIMMVRAVPDGDEHDKDIALAIRYAVDNGAQVINMSFGKSFSPEKKWVDDAVKYAESKGVLLVHAAGNDAKDVDTTWNFPTPVFLSGGKQADNWITVGASGESLGDGLVAEFSNYGKKEVDVFAPGKKIYSTVPTGNNYQNLQGTSMASPVVAGVAALILEYFPDLSAQQVKMVIDKSTYKPTGKVKDPGTGEEVSLNELSVTGGIVNAYEAVKLASTLKGERNLKPAGKKAF